MGGKQSSCPENMEIVVANIKETAQNNCIVMYSRKGCPYCTMADKVRKAYGQNLSNQIAVLVKGNIFLPCNVYFLQDFWYHIQQRLKNMGNYDGIDH